MRFQSTRAGDSATATAFTRHLGTSTGQRRLDGNLRHIRPGANRATSVVRQSALVHRPEGLCLTVPPIDP
jgi:hypothetical protein